MRLILSKWQLQIPVQVLRVVLTKCVFYCPNGNCRPQSRCKVVVPNVFIIAHMAIADPVQAQRCSPKRAIANPSPGATFVILNVFIFILVAIADINAFINVQIAIADPS